MQMMISSHGRLIDLSHPVVMGILNITPDSFYDGGRYVNTKAMLHRVEEMLTDGAVFLDIGALSSRPGAESISAKDEWQRLEPALKAVVQEFPDAVLSVDTFRSDIARRAVDGYGVSMINDISGGRFDEAMFGTIAELKVAYVLMHMQGKPENMQQNPVYANVLKDVLKYLSERLNALRLLGVGDVIVDPGFGFGKTIEDNYILLNQLSSFQFLDCPLLVGLSRKSMVYKLLECTPESALNGTTVLHTLALQQGANILRVHDVKAAAEAIRLVDYYQAYKPTT